MKVILNENCGPYTDYELPSIDIYAYNLKDAFHLGMVMEAITHLGLEAKILDVGIRIPLMKGELNGTES